MIAERVLMTLLLGGIALGCAVVLQPFVSAILWAAILVYSTWPVFSWLRVRARLGRGGTAAAMIVLTVLLIVLPMALAAPGAANEIRTLKPVVQNWVQTGLPLAPPWFAHLPLIGQALAAVWNKWSADLRGLEALLQPYLGAIAEDSLSVLLGVAGGLVQIIVALFIAFFFWVSGDALALHLQGGLRRICGGYADRLILVTGNTVRGTVYGILGTAIVQGVLTGLGLWATGVPRAALLGTIAAFLSVLPIGAPVIWVPAVFWLLLNGHMASGIFLCTYGILAISGADHLIRPYFIARGAKLPFLLTVIGVLGGVLGFGLLGVFLGPVLLGVGFTLVAEFARGGMARAVLDRGAYD